jgi:hypothetical protein
LNLKLFQEIFEENLVHLREAVAILQVEPEGKEELQHQGPILQNSASAENFSDKISPSNFGQISTQK